MPGSDWRNDGGWAIVMDRGSGVQTITTFIRGDNPERTMSQYNLYQYTGRAAHIDNSAGTRSKQQIGSRPVSQQFGNPYTHRPDWIWFDAYQQGRWDGYQGLRLHANNGNPHPSHLVVIDVNKDGNIDAQDAIFGDSNDKLYLLWFTTTEQPYGSSYIRWADLQWCR